MDIRKTDGKGRISLGEKDKHYFVTGPVEGAYQLREVPEIEELPEGYEYAETSAAKEDVMDIVADCIEHWIWYGGKEYPENPREENHQDSITVADKIVEHLLKAGVIIPEDYGLKGSTVD